jgi:hypothetical protein
MELDALSYTEEAGKVQHSWNTGDNEKLTVVKPSKTI